MEVTMISTDRVMPLALVALAALLLAGCAETPVEMDEEPEWTLWEAFTMTKEVMPPDDVADPPHLELQVDEGGVIRISGEIFFPPEHQICGVYDPEVRRGDVWFDVLPFTSAMACSFEPYARRYTIEIRDVPPCEWFVRVRQPITPALQTWVTIP
jgi:hypothetical protein